MIRDPMVILLGSLWGPWKKVSLNRVWTGLSMILKGPFILLAHGVRMCQRRFCGHVLEEDWKDPGWNLIVF
jgi:hypothetical protein